MRCKFVRSVFQNEESGYCVFVYHTMDEEEVPASARNTYYKGSGIQFSAVGSYLPAMDNVEVELYGKWINGKYGPQLSVENFLEILPQTKEGIIGYLSSGMIKGIGPSTAERIVEKFGLNTFEIMDKEPRRLLEVKGITHRKLESIVDEYQKSHVIRDLMSYLAVYKVSRKKVQKIHEKFGDTALDVVRNNPFQLCQIKGFGFLTVDEIARAGKCRLNDPLRIEGCISYCLELNMQEGHLFAERDKFIKTVHEQLNYGFSKEVATVEDISRSIYQMNEDEKIVLDNRSIYTYKKYEEEKETAETIAEILADDEEEKICVDLLLVEAQKELHIELSKKQIEAVRMVFSHKLSIIKGGPGTGKTTLEKVLLFINEKLDGGKVMLMAPTGRAARKMAESTGMDCASTIHKGLELGAEDSEYDPQLFPLETDFLILDEQSMVDMYLASVMAVENVLTSREVDDEKISK